MNVKLAKICVSILGTILAIGVLLPLSTALANTSTGTAQVKPATVSLTGTIKKLAVSGTCYQLAADNGKKYELMGKFPKIDGTRVQISGVPKTDMVTICQVGQPLQVKTVKVIK
ncbi:hypothetical protein [Chamaesiphon polymorphus]|uniref:Uncharacterized protein n=1 Tax=Chamaesiphon polymorphus CCALA 037 TaxID=2107692 RepID=A0A2T1GN13_9CYAN|nr:hypothetical protein [Chamaesiphon polymorphus]PSB59272.1 hypothetical protein C7B77_01505 [Chamaesiphon polymorphus CCALA 037]